MFKAITELVLGMTLAFGSLIWSDTTSECGDVGRTIVSMVVLLAGVLLMLRGCVDFATAAF